MPFTKRQPIGIAAALPAIFLGSLVLAQPVPVPKTNPMKVYMHYMPWFETPATLGGTNWGYHWKFNNRNPNIVDASGKRQIASHYYPMIGPYASRDADVIEYHMLLMRFSGVDGVLIDWYGVQGTNGDIGQLLTSSNAIVDRVDDFGMGFGVVLEDRFSTTSHGNGVPDINKGKANVAYLRDNYFNKPEYIRLGAAEDPLVGVFGPITFQQPSHWTQILAEAGEPVNFLPLWYESGDAGANADGEYAWIYENESSDNHLTHQRSFLNTRAPTLGTAGGVAYPGFNDYYLEGGVGNIVPFEIPHDNGNTLDAVLDQVQDYIDIDPNRIDFLQLATFNDFGEGTMFEPTIETGFEYLKAIQAFTGVSFGEAELQLVYRLYLARKKYAGNASIAADLDEVSDLLTGLDIAGASSFLSSTAPAGDYDADGDVDANDYTAWRAKFASSTILYGSGADGTFDGAVDAHDYVLWRKFAVEGGAGNLAGPSVPEPVSSGLIAIAAAICCSCRLYGRRGRCSVMV